MRISPRRGEALIGEGVEGKKIEREEGDLLPQRTVKVMLAWPVAPASSVTVRTTTYLPRLISEGGFEKELSVERVPSRDEDHRYE